MKENTKADALLITVTSVFLILVPVFISGAFSRPAIPPESRMVDPVFTSPAPIRLSARALIKADADVSGMMCYSCHKETGENLVLKRDAEGLVTVSTNHADLVYSRLNCVACHGTDEGVELTWDHDDQLVIPAAHAQPPMRHGRFGRNNDCFNCHIREQLDKLRTRNGAVFDLQDSTPLCASCHGPAYRDWELGIHGRGNGHWDRRAGETVKLDCTACHDPHSPAFPSVKPGPSPYPGAIEQTTKHSLKLEAIGE
ncbi:MAG: hypothetical protein ISQ14_03505 [Verrucomicrobiae bacterium]|nr:hypothetical protein [Verrucomicrobiae bacterium]